MGWIGQRIACQMMKTADFLAVTPSFFARALLARGSRGEGDREIPLRLSTTGISRERDRSCLRRCSAAGLPWGKGLQVGLSWRCPCLL